MQLHSLTQHDEFISVDLRAAHQMNSGVRIAYDLFSLVPEWILGVFWKKTEGTIF